MSGPTDPWGDGRVHRVLAYGFEAFGRNGRADATKIARQLQVTPATVRRWMRTSLPAKRRAQVGARVLPAQEAVGFESKEYDFAKSALENIYALGSSPVPYWKENGWLQPHILGIVHLQKYGICVPRIASANGDAKVQARMRADQGVVIDQQVFPNRFAAQVAKGQLLADIADWRVVVPAGYVSRGRTEAWLYEAPRKLLSWYFDHAPVKPPATPKRRRASRKTT